MIRLLDTYILTILCTWRTVFVTIKHHLPTTWRDMDSKFTSPSEEMTMSLLGSNRPSYQFWVKGVQPFNMDVTLQVLALFPF